jgi:hypothetical protein
MIVAANTAYLQNAVCAVRGHNLAVLEYPGRTEEVGGYPKEVPPGFDIRCTACGLTLEEIRAGEMNTTTRPAAESH